jgi:serine/threonine protein kinase
MVERCDISIGQRIDNRYTVTKSLGEGAFGMVFKVNDASGQTYALKVLKLWEVHPEIRQQLADRFEMEYQTGQIDSPYLVHSVGHGYVNGNPYILMEFCPNGDLSHAPKNTDWNLVGQQILLGLKSLHQCGKVHRDLKPENVLIKQDGTAALTDFGISGDRNKRMTERNLLGKPQQIFGTYAYMPPEQVNPHRDATVLPTTDIFSFGVMMYQLITGNLPFGTLNDENELVLYLKAGKEGRWNRSALTTSRYGTMYMPVIEGCLQPDFRKRLQSVTEVLAMLPKAEMQYSIPQEEPLHIPSFIRGLLLRVMQGEEYGRTYDLTEAGRQTGGVVTMGRQDFSVQNTLPIVEQNSSYISRKHCTFEYDAPSQQWFIRDGQWDRMAIGGWKSSLNGTYVNAKEVSSNGYYIQIGDIISIGDTKLRVEAY